MERIIYRITLDSHKTGIQRTLQGFETADNMARTIAVNITASGDTYEIPLDNVVAMMYVTTPNASEPSINECRIEDNTIYYDVLPIVEEGITEMKIKLIETSVDGAKRVLLAPKFVVEVTESGTEDDSAEQTTTFTALENAIAKAHGVYDQRLLNIEIGPDCVFRAIYADGTVYENHYLHEALYNGNALLSESWAKGETGIREGEETNNSKYFSNVSKSSSIEASASADMVRGLVDMAKLYSTYTSFDTNFKTGELEYISASHNFDVNEETGELEVEGELFDPTDVLEKVADDYLDEKTQEISKNTEDIDSVEKEVTQLKSDFNEYKGKTDVLESRPVNNNILINSNFANPVNQRGKTEYTGGDYAIDRWKIPYTGISAKVNSNSVTLTNNETGTNFFTQLVEFPEKYAGKTLTLTIKVKSVSDDGICEMYIEDSTISGPFTVLTQGVNTLTKTISPDTAKLNVCIRCTGNCVVELEWAKLELGDHATPYVPRLYAEELELCQRYYQKYNRYSSRTTGYRTPDVRHFYATFRYSEMRVYPSVKSGTIYLNKLGDSDRIELTEDGHYALGNGYIQFSGYTNNLNNTDGTFDIYDIELDAEL